MVDVEEARNQILAAFSALAPVTVGLADALGMVPADELLAPHDLPRFDNSAMDGYAVRHADVAAAPARLEVTGEVRAGDDPGVTVTPGTAVRIMTGGRVPAGADAVVPVEDTNEDAGAVTIGAVPAPGAHIRPAGEDVRKGAPLVPAGIELGPGELALLASTGHASLRVHRRPHVVIVSTGDELVAPGDEPGPGQIRDSNSVALRALVTDAGATADVIGPVADERAAVRAAFLDAADRGDLVVSSGGVSVGRYDFVKEVVEETGAIDLWRVAMQPGKPVVSGRVGATPFLGLPGNPVSIHVGFEQFVRPALRKMRGCKVLVRPTVRARLAAPLEKKPGRLHFVRVRLQSDDDGMIAVPTGGQGSHIQSSLVDCHGVARFAAAATHLAAGDEVTVEVWRLP